jgi:hypothetical protein
MTTNLNRTFAAVQAASRELALLNDDTINQILNAVADTQIPNKKPKELEFLPTLDRKMIN